LILRGINSFIYGGYHTGSINTGGDKPLIYNYRTPDLTTNIKGVMSFFQHPLPPLARGGFYIASWKEWDTTGFSLS
jgi:hypothetical protein